YDNNGNLLESAMVSIPAKPSGLVAATSGGPGIGLSWNSAQDAVEYQIYRRSGDNMLWRNLGTVPADTVMFFDTTTLGDTEYFYQIVAVGTDGLSAYSDSTPAVIDPSGVGFLFNFRGQNENTMMYEIEYKAESGAAYQFESSHTLQIEDWMPYAYSRFPDGNEAANTIQNASGAIKLYFSTDDSELPIFFRLAQISE
ncbi:MAG: fibronectin type III domain-containing protein, partial [Verrucomicrobia bacterium]|nr:fibronectin type III domain-containing protein [Verrucomicrobiota bacterium]